ncbi:MAG: hypothetical protein LBE38_04690 [Deltaproteobacteria bacterium]|nr:hypothetical protein [Deltaproteobacteria bacterium]
MLVNNTANSLPGLLVATLLDGQKQQTDLAIKQIQVIAKQQQEIQKQQTTLLAVALLTGIGSKLDIVV